MSASVKVLANPISVEISGGTVNRDKDLLANC